VVDRFKVFVTTHSYYWKRLIQKEGQNDNISYLFGAWMDHLNKNLIRLPSKFCYYSISFEEFKEIPILYMLILFHRVKNMRTYIPWKTSNS